MTEQPTVRCDVSERAVFLTADQLDTLRHMLGINDPSYSRPRPYRNYAAVEPGDAHFVELERLGLVELCQAAYPPLTQYDYYRCSDEGRAAAFLSYRTIRLSRSKRRYRAFLSARDAYQDLTFREFLTDPVFAEARER